MLRDLVMHREWRTCIPMEYRCTRPEYNTIADQFRKILKPAPVFEISNVSEYFYQGTDQTHWGIYSDFPRPMPPFRATWLEWRIPKTVLEKGVLGDLPLSEKFNRAGCLVHTRPLGDYHKLHLPIGCENGISVTFFLEERDSRTPAIVCTQNFAIGPNWDLLSLTKIEKGIAFSYPTCNVEVAHKTEAGWEALRYVDDFSNQLSFPAFLAMSLLNCKNVVTKEVTTPPALVKANKRRGHEITPSHLLIEIQPITVRTARESGAPGYSKAAVSIIRGHFKDYSNGKGLFGRYKGMFWWDQRLSLPADTSAEYRFKSATGPLDERWIHAVK